MEDKQEDQQGDEGRQDEGAQNDTGDASGDDNGGEEKRFTQAEVDRIVKDRVQREKAKADKAAADAADEATRKAAEEQGEFKDLYEKEKARADAAEQEKADLELAAMRRRAADNTGLPQAFADRLQGETLDEMVADAKGLLKAMPKQDGAPDINAGSRGRTTEPTTDELVAQKKQSGVYGPL